MKSEIELKQLLRDWVLKKNTKIKTEELQDNTPLLQSRIISSVHIMDLILHLEKLRSKPIDVKKLNAGVFSSIDSIYQNFLKPEAI